MAWVMLAVISQLMLGQLMDEDPRAGRVISTGEVGSRKNRKLVLLRGWAQEEDVGESVLKDGLHGGRKEGGQGRME